MQQEAIARELHSRLPSIGELAQELAEDPLILSFIAMISEDIRKQILRQLGLPEKLEIPPAPGDRVEPPSPTENPGGLDRQA